jgi:hypothetical protein
LIYQIEYNENRMTFILKGRVRGRQERQIGLLDMGRQGSDRYGNVQLRNVWQGPKECGGT